MLQAVAEFGASAKSVSSILGLTRKLGVWLKSSASPPALGVSRSSASPTRGWIDAVWLSEADFSCEWEKDIPTTCDECDLSPETVNPAWMYQSRLPALAGWGGGGMLWDWQAPFNPDSLDEMAPVSPAGKC